MDVSAGVVAAQVVSTALSAALTGSAQEAGVTVVEWVKSHFGGRPELDRVQDAPDSPTRMNALAEIIDAEIIEDPHLAQQLKELLEQVQGYDETIVQNAIGDQNINAAHSNVTVTFASSTQKPSARLAIEWEAGDTYSVVNRGTAIARQVAYSWDESLILRQRDTTPDDLNPDEGLSFMMMRSFGTTDDRLTVTWTDEDGQTHDRRLRIPHRKDR